LLFRFIVSSWFRALTVLEQRMCTGFAMVDSPLRTKDPTVQTVLKTEEEDDSDWAEMEATEIQALLEDRIQNIDKIHRRWFKTTNSRISDVEKRLLNIDMQLAEILRKLSHVL
jgi:hypothetical protein